MSRALRFLTWDFGIVANVLRFCFFLFDIFLVQQGEDYHEEYLVGVFDFEHVPSEDEQRGDTGYCGRCEGDESLPQIVRSSQIWQDR